jgi:hypothetical protein
MFSLWIGAYDQGLAYAGLALGTYMTLRVLNFPDLTVDGSFALGGGTAAVLISQGAPVPVALGLAILFGCLAGTVTGLIHHRPLFDHPAADGALQHPPVRNPRLRPIPARALKRPWQKLATSPAKPSISSRRMPPARRPTPPW